MKKLLTLLFFSIGLTNQVNCQYFVKQKKTRVSNLTNTFFFYVGFNRTNYISSAPRFIGPGYDFQLSKAKFVDQFAPFGQKNYFHKNPIVSPQYNFKVGFFFRDNWSVAIGMNWFNFVLENRSRVFIYGVIRQSANKVDYGRFDGAERIIDTNNFQYKNMAMIYMPVEFAKTKMHRKKNKGKQFGLSTSLGIGLGPIISRNYYLFADTLNTKPINSLSGIGVSGEFGVKTEWYNRVFLNINLSTGYLAQTHVKTRTNSNSYSIQHIFYTSLNFGAGFYLFGNTGNKCKTCPTW